MVEAKLKKFMEFFDKMGLTRFFVETRSTFDEVQKIMELACIC